MAQISSSYGEAPDAFSQLRSLTGPDPNNRNARFVLVGLNHRSAPMEVRRRVSFSKDLLPEALRQLSSEVSDGVILSTCSRTEVYTMAHDPERSAHRIMEFLHRFHGLDQGFAEPFLYVRTDDDAANHLFKVAAGLDSAVLGEWQILDQVRQALKAATNRTQISLPTSLYRLFHGAVETGREARMETGFGEKGTDLGQAVALCAKAALGSINAARVLIIGAGEIAKLTAQAFLEAGVAQITIANRSMERGRLLAEAVTGVAVPSAEIPQALQRADIIVSATGAPYFTITKEMVMDAKRIRQNGMGKPLRKLTGLTDDQSSAIDTLTRSIVKKLLHEPIQALKESAGKYEPGGHVLDSIREPRPSEKRAGEQIGSNKNSLI